LNLTPIISILIPVYNNEEYLYRCLNSIISQTFLKYECILIDDGSTDNSRAICNEFSSKDNRFITLYQENRGVSSARNKGLDIARGKWITFVDSDDWCDSEMLQILYDLVINYTADVSICNLIRTNTIYVQEKKASNPRKTIMSGKQAIIEMFAGNIFGTSACAKLIRSDIIEQHSIRFSKDIHYSEDALYYYEIFKNAGKVVCVSSACYYYYTNFNSITRQKRINDKIKSCFFAYEKMLEIETDKRIRKSLYSAMTKEAYFKSVSYMLENNLDDGAFIYLMKKMKIGLVYLLTNRKIKARYKAACFFAMFPRLFLNLYSCRRGLIPRLLGRLKRY
jgi:glycosyltransferase involved in cell wall biosynthesis